MIKETHYENVPLICIIGPLPVWYICQLQLGWHPVAVHIYT
jgi:hypothetical protein